MKKFLLFFLVFFPFSVLAIQTSASSAILVDTDSGRIMYSHNIHSRRSVASISKIMTT